MYSLLITVYNNVISTLLLFLLLNDTSTTNIYTLSLHDALLISLVGSNMSNLSFAPEKRLRDAYDRLKKRGITLASNRSEEHTSELQSQSNIVCRLLLEKKKIINIIIIH